MQTLRRLLILLCLTIATVVVLQAAASYPSGTKSFTTKTSGQTIASSHVNEIQDEIVAIENGLLSGLAHVIKPLTDATYDLGASGKQWKNLYLSGSLIVGGSTVSLTPDLSTCGLRLSLTTATPMTTSDVTAATTVFVTPTKGGQCAFYDGSATWTMLTNAEVSIAVPATTSTIYDVWCRNNSGTIACDTTAWTNDTTRATALTTQNNVYVKTGDTTRRYIGSFRTTTVSGQTEDSAVKRYVWNYYNRIDKPLLRQESTASWTYSTSTIRQANNAAANQLDVVIGVAEVSIRARVAVVASVSTRQVASVGIGLNSTSAYEASNIGGGTSVTGADQMFLWAEANLFPAVGRSTITWLEWSQTAGTTTWYGHNFTNFPTGTNSGISGSVAC
jgi:hypothetical protein